MAGNRTVSEADWAKYGLSGQTPVAQGDRADQPSDSLFAEQQMQQNADPDRPWWKANFFLKEPALFGTWDGVFTSVMVNIFGVIVFLRMGWIVGQAGVGHALLLLALCAGLALTTVLSAIGICERCQIQSGGVYFFLSHILGAQIGGTLGVLYCFAQAVGTSMVAVGFGETVAHMLTGSSDNVWLVRFVAVAVLIALAAVNFAGVIWVVKLQLALLALLALAFGDFIVGSFVRYEPDDGVVGMNATNFQMNMPSHFTDGQTFFSVFGVFFSNFIGMLAGVNMSGDLRNPSKNIPLGELSAVGASCSCCFVFILLIGATCERSFLLDDATTSMMAEQVSATRLLFMLGLYVSSLSSILGSTYGTPQVLQRMAAENVIPILRPLEAGKGANNNPVYAMMTVTAVSLVFVMVGDLNQLAIISTIPFLITYAYVDYAYVSLAITYDIQQHRRVRDQRLGASGYGAVGKVNEASDLDHLFPERQHLKGARLPQQQRDADKQGLVTPEEFNEADAPGHIPLIDKSDSHPQIVLQQQSWYSMFCNRWVSVIGMVINFMIIFPMNLKISLAYVILSVALYFYIGKVSPGSFPGITEFGVHELIAMVIAKIRGEDEQQVVLPPALSSMSVQDEHMNDANADYEERKQYHQSSTHPMPATQLH